MLNVEKYPEYHDAGLDDLMRQALGATRAATIAVDMGCIKSAPIDRIWCAAASVEKLLIDIEKRLSADGSPHEAVINDEATRARDAIDDASCLAARAAMAGYNHKPLHCHPEIVELLEQTCSALEESARELMVSAEWYITDVMDWEGLTRALENNEARQRTGRISLFGVTDE